LTGRRVAILEARMTDALARLLEREGATVVVAPAVAEQPAADPAAIAAFVDALTGGGYAAVVFQTGAGAQGLLDAVDRLGRRQDALEGFRRTRVVSRGPKPAAVLRAHGITADVMVRAPWTTAECIDTVTALPIERQRVALLHYGEENPRLTAAIRDAEAELDELVLYRWTLPADVGPLSTLVDEVCAARLQVVVFTTQIQVRHLFEIARRGRRETELRTALATLTTTAAIGPTCAAALAAEGVRPSIVPERPKMGALVAAVSEWFAGNP
jgi:uroporphyrinogen-III synthase